MQSIGIGSKTSTGGVVIEGNQGIMFNGVVASSVGHKATCPSCKKGIGEIIAVGDRQVSLPAGPATRAGDYIACGCPTGLNVLLGEGSVLIGSDNVSTYASLSAPTHTPIIDATQPSFSSSNNVLNSITPTLDTDQKSEDSDTEFTVTDISNVMNNKLNWPKSAEVMDLWFSLPAREMTDKEKKNDTKAIHFPDAYINSTLFNWIWLEQFDVVNKALNALKGRLDNDAAKGIIKTRLINFLTKNKSAISNGNRFDNGMSVAELHSNWQYQLANVSYDLGEVDDLYGSLGNFALYAAIKRFSVFPIGNNRYQVVIPEVAVYMRDTYDFIGSQYLGHWNFDGMGLNLVGGVANKISFEWTLPAWILKNGVADAFGNSDFNSYRESENKGGDLLLFSDIKLLPVNIQLIIEI